MFACCLARVTSWFRLSIVLITTLTIALMLSGCATIFSKSTYHVNIQTDPQKANIIIRDINNNAVVYKGRSGIISLKSSSGFLKGATYRITASAVGYHSSDFLLDSTLSSTYFLNLLAGGLIGMLIIDPATGAMFNLETQVHITLNKK